MSRQGHGVLAGTLLAMVAAAGPARAQQQGEDRFFFDAPESEEDKEDTAIDGSLTSTSFFYREVGGVGTPVADNRAAPDSASPVDRFFTDLRAQLEAEHIKGSAWDFRADVRGRLTPELCATRRAGMVTVEDCTPSQSGVFGGSEIEGREFYLLRRGDKTDWLVGRQYVLELAATKIDGVQLRRRSGDWTYLAFGGLYPSRISRDIREDYPKVPVDTEDPMAGVERAYPVTAGAGGAYRFEKAHGSLGVVGIFPLANDENTGTIEENRVFATASGYYRRSLKLDIYHYLVVDGTGASGAGITNLTLGVNYRPKPLVRAFAQVSRIDTDTLNINAQNRLEDPDASDATTGIVQNNIEVLRIAQESVRAGLSSALVQNRFELSATGTLRRRPEFAVQLRNDEEFVFSKAQAADVTIRGVDRRSWKDLRVGLSVTRTFGIGDVNLDRSEAISARADATREILDGRGEIEASLSFLRSNDESRMEDCGATAPMDPLACYGTSRSTSITAGGLIFYRPKKKWFVVGLVNLGSQKLVTSSAMMGEPVAQPRILQFTALGRVAYRF